MQFNTTSIMDGFEFVNGSFEIRHLSKHLPRSSELITDLRLPSRANLGFNVETS